MCRHPTQQLRGNRSGRYRRKLPWRKSVIEALSNSFQWLVNDGSNPTILFAGNNIGEDYLSELTAYLKGKKFGVINISKSGTTTETALTFRLLKKQCEEQRGKEEAKKVIVLLLTPRRVLPVQQPQKKATKTFVIPDNVGGRFSVLTPVDSYLSHAQDSTSRNS